MERLDIGRIHRLLARIAGPNRIGVVQFMQAQAKESQLHAQQAGGHPSMGIEEFARTHIAAEEQHMMELRKMMRDIHAPCMTPARKHSHRKR